MQQNMDMSQFSVVEDAFQAASIINPAQLDPLWLQTTSKIGKTRGTHEKVPSPAWLALATIYALRGRRDADDSEPP
jgi:hypothetical protein